MTEVGCSFINRIPRIAEKPNFKHKGILKKDSNRHILYETGDVMQGRYHIFSTLGKGTFGKVLKVYDNILMKPLAVKVIKSSSKYRETAKEEIEYLKFINTLDDNHQKMYDWFDYHGHLCIVFEALGSSIYDFMEENNFEPYPFEQIQEIAYQLIYAVQILHRNHLTHTDLKPENILFENSTYEIIPIGNITYRRVLDTKIRVIDFGSATFEQEYHAKLVSTRQYRAPEVILQLGWSHPCDVWSIACILLELYKGDLVFDTHDDIEHLAMMEKVLGKLPRSMTSKSKSGYYLNGKLDLDYNMSLSVNESYSALPCYIDYEHEEHLKFFDLLTKMFRYQPSERITLVEALEHPLFDDLSPEIKKHCQ